MHVNSPSECLVSLLLSVRYLVLGHSKRIYLIKQVVIFKQSKFFWGENWLAVVFAQNNYPIFVIEGIFFNQYDISSEAIKRASKAKMTK